MVSPRVVSLVLVALLLALAPAAYASPPDQTWIGGWYDNGDYDDVVMFITGGLGGIQPDLTWSPRVVVVVIGLVQQADPATPAPTPLASGPSRAPPLA